MFGQADFHETATAEFILQVQESLFLGAIAIGLKQNLNGEFGERFHGIDRQEQAVGRAIEVN